MIGLLVLGVIIAMGAYTAVRGRGKLRRADWWLNLVALFCGAACFALQVCG